MRFKEGTDRHQLQFFTKLDDLVDDKHYVRLIDAFVDSFINEFISCFSKGDKAVGRKAYHPGSLLKLYIYSYLNGISTSRKIEKECNRNIEVMWLTGHLAPDHKTISDFRKENGDGIRLAFKSLNLLLKQNRYIKGHTISVDGSKIRANAGRSIDLESITKKLDNLESQLEDYLHQLASTDQLDDELEYKQKQKAEFEKQIEALKQKVNQLQQQKEMLEKSGAKRLSPTDPDARIMKSRQGKHYCYNMQAAVDDEHQFIASSYVISNENDKGQLSPMVETLDKHLSIVPKELLADAGYYVINQIETLEKQNGIDCYVAIQYNQQQAKGINFDYDPNNNSYLCSQGQQLKPKYGWKTDKRRGTKAQAYVGVNCEPCPVRPCCTSSKARTVYRFSNQSWKDEYQNKLESKCGKQKLIRRKALSEHPFGTLKYWMGHIPLKTRGLQNVGTEIGLYSICYNLKRLINIESFDRIKQLFTYKNILNSQFKTQYCLLAA